MYTTVARWGNSQGIRIPKSLLEALGLKENDRVELTCENDTITLRRATAHKHRTLEERLVSFYGKPLDEIPPVQVSEVNWGRPEGREIW